MFLKLPALVIVCFFCHGLVTVASADESSWLHAAIVAHAAAQGADLATTAYQMGRYPDRVKEANPLFRPLAHRPVWLGVVKGVTATGISYGLIRLHRRHPRLAHVLAWSGAAAILGIAISNVRRIEEQR